MLSAYSFVLLVALVSNANGENKKLPSYIKPCSMKDKAFNSCVKQQIANALPLFTKGVQDLGVPSIDPVKLNDIIIDGGGLKLTFTEAEMYGLSNSKLTDLKITLGKAEEEFTLEFRSDFMLKSQYKADGRILILPIVGEGDALITANGVDISLSSKFTHIKDSSGEHLKLTSPTYKYTINQTIFDLKNLFNGNKELADTTLQFANANSQQLMDELSPSAIKQIVRTCVKAINKFFSQVTIDDIVDGYEKL